MATLRGYVNRYGARAAARLLGVSDSTVREALGGNRRRGLSDERRERTFIRLNTRMRQLTGERTPSELKPKAPGPVVSDVDVLAAGSFDKHATKHAVQVGEADQRDANGAIIGKPVRKVVHDRQLAALLTKAIADFGHGSGWAIAFYGEFTPSRGYSANTKSGNHRGWFTRKIAGDPAGNEHPAVRLARDVREDLELDIRSLPQGMTPEVQRKMTRDLKADYINRWAESITGQHWVKVHAIWISKAKQY